MFPSPTARKIAIIGGGISGLSAAHRLQELAPDCDIHLYEADGKLGGVLQTTHQNGFLLEHSADNFITNVPGGLQLCSRLGLEAELLKTNETLRKALVVREGKLYPVPDGFLLMAPGKIWPVVTTPLLSWRGKLRLAAEPFVARRTSVEDESLESFVVRRMGDEVYRRLVQPLIGGIYTADPTKLSVRATLAQFVAMEQEHGSLVRGMLNRTAKNKSESRESGARYSMFVAPKNGMGQLVERLVEKLSSATIHLNRSVEKLAKTAAGWHVFSGGSPEPYDGVILALPAPQAARLLPDSPELSANLASIAYAGCNVAILAVDQSQIAKPVSGFGFVVPEIENRKILAVSFSSAKYSGRAPDGKMIIRVFVGGACHPELTSLDDDQIKQIVQAELAELIGLQGDPEIFLVTRWTGKMPQYHLGHVELIEQIFQQVDLLPGLELAGNAYRGVGVPQCIQSGESAAERLVGSIGPAAIARTGEALDQ